MPTDARPSARRILASVAIIGFVVGGAAAAWRAVDDEERSTFAGLFPTQAIDLRLNGPAGVDGFLRGDNLAPGDRASGALSLSTRDPLEPGLADLDVGVELAIQGISGVHRLDEALVVTRLAYGVDDLLSGRDPGRNATAELDTDLDGKVSLLELAAGLADLPPPAPGSAGGTALILELAFQPRSNAQSSDFGGQELDVRFTFQLGDAVGPDL